MFKSRISGLATLAGGACAIISAAAPRAALALTFHYRMDPVASAVTAAVSEPFGSKDAEGTFKIIDGEIFLDPNNPGTGAVKLIIDATSYHSDQPQRDQAVLAALGADKYPTIRFESTSLSDVNQTSNTDGSATVNGDLTLHGQTMPVSVEVHVEITTDTSKAVAEGQATFRYKDWGVKVPTIMLFHAGDETTINFHITANRVAD